jgi:hypothetical protein
MKTRVVRSRSDGVYYVEYSKWLLWWHYMGDEGFGFKYYASLEQALVVAKKVSVEGVTRYPRIIWESE